MYLTGTAGAQAPTTALNSLKTFLEAALNTPAYKAQFKAVYSRFTKVHVATPDTPDSKVNDFASVEPFLFLEITKDNQEPWKKPVDGVTKRGTRHEMEILIEVVCSDACRPVEALLKPALLEVIDAGMSDLGALAIEEIEVSAGTGSYPNVNRVNPHTLACAVHALRI
jgi:hypothetical protein